MLLRRIIQIPASAADGSPVGHWRLFSAEAQSRVKDGLLQALAREPEQHIRRKLSHAIAETSLSAAGSGGADWPALLPAIFGLAGAPDASLRETGLHAFVQLCDYAGETVLLPHVAQLHPVLAGLLNDGEGKVRVVALEAVISLLKRIKEEAARSPFQALLPQLFKVLELALTTDELQVRQLAVQRECKGASPQGAAHLKFRRVRLSKRSLSSSKTTRHLCARSSSR